ncbi:MAG: DUF2066 domain-containing protein [Pseudomonadota bacterium]|nr:DUF2066 domain-containing protein [Pseudomonadota bacterium]MEE3133632.1 DUF2066 domain-containing protein [Pseudomonadota bacterium]
MKRLASLLVLMCSCFETRADVIDWLYDVEVPVATQSSSDTRAAAARALATVLTRVTGLKVIPRNPMVTTALRNPGRFYARYRFVRKAGGAKDAMDQQTVLEVGFDPRTIQDLVRSAALPIWSANRPSVLAWIVLEEDVPSLAASDDTTPWVRTIKARSRDRGLLVQLPLMDLVDRERISGSTVSGGFSEQILGASERYGAQYVLTARIWMDGGGLWRGVGGLMFEGRQTNFAHEGETRDEVCEKVLDAVADELVQRFVVFGLHTEGISIWVSGITSVSEYGSLLRYLQSLEFIDRVDVAEVSIDRIRIVVHTRSTLRGLSELLYSDGVITRDASKNSDFGLNQYVWRGEQ